MQVMNFAHCLHIVLVAGKHTDVFKGDFFWWGGERVTWEDLSMEKLFIGEENFHVGVLYFQHYLKKSENKFKKKYFFQLKVRSNIET